MGKGQRGTQSHMRISAYFIMQRDGETAWLHSTSMWVQGLLSHRSRDRDVHFIAPHSHDPHPRTTPSHLCLRYDITLQGRYWRFGISSAANTPILNQCTAFLQGVESRFEMNGQFDYYIVMLPAIYILKNYTICISYWSKMTFLPKIQIQFLSQIWGGIHKLPWQSKWRLFMKHK